MARCGRRAHRVGARDGRHAAARFWWRQDGEVSVEELESAVMRLVQRVARLTGRLRRLFARQRNLSLAVCSLGGLAYGGHLAHTVLFIQAFASTFATTSALASTATSLTLALVSNPALAFSSARAHTAGFVATSLA